MLCNVLYVTSHSGLPTTGFLRSAVFVGAIVRARVRIWWAAATASGVGGGMEWEGWY